MGLFKQEHSFSDRASEVQRIRRKYPDRVPVICERQGTSVPTIDKHKYLVPSDLTVGQFMYVIRRRITLPPEQAIFLFIDNQLPPTQATFGLLYEEHREKDGFLYITYSGENTFG